MWGIEAVLTVDHPRGNRVSLNWLLYDGHGNWVRLMAPDYRLSGFQWRGVWGEVQGSLGTGRGYCVNLGHPEDETGLVYMRARYYEPATGRFISEDPARDGVNWYLYADGNPVNKVDVDGLSVLLEHEFATAEAAALSGLGNTAARAILGRAKSIVNILQEKYKFLEKVVKYGFDKGGNFGIRFKDIRGREQLFRFVYEDGRWVIKHDSSKYNFGIPHHIDYSSEYKVLQPLLDLLNALYP